MSDDADYDLTGVWQGFYNMPNGEPPTQFEATIRDNHSLLSGLTTELGDTEDCAGQILHAVIEGGREGAFVHFEKRYDYLPRADYAVYYEGMLQAGGDEIDGRWSIPGIWSGTFLMVRGAREEAAAELTVEAKV